MLEKRKTTENDDYEFLDETDDLNDEDVMVSDPNLQRQRLPQRPRLRLRQKREAINANYHVVFKRKDKLEHSSDYGNFQFSYDLAQKWRSRKLFMNFQWF